jgi:GTP-binding protein YchF
MKAGLVGYAQSGKTTLFNALTGQSAQTGAGQKGKSNLGVIKVPDERLDRLTAIYHPRRTVPAEVIFVDVPGPRTKGGGLDGPNIQAVQEADALVVVLRGFEGGDGTAPNPARELADFEAELILADLGVVERRLERLAKERGSERQKAVLERCLEALNGEQSLRRIDLSSEDEREISSFAFLSRRPLLAVLNTQEADMGKGIPAELGASARERGVEVVDVCAAVEAEIATLDPAEQTEFLASMGIAEPASARFIRAAYSLLDYISFFTVGEDEVRAWTVRRGSKAPKAAGRVHSDMERGFIRAEVMTYDEFIPVGNEARMKELGKLRVEGKEYVVLDGDILHFRFAV